MSKRKVNLDNEDYLVMKTSAKKNPKTRTPALVIAGVIILLAVVATYFLLTTGCTGGILDGCLNMNPLYVAIIWLGVVICFIGSFLKRLSESDAGNFLAWLIIGLITASIFFGLLVFFIVQLL